MPAKKKTRGGAMPMAQAQMMPQGQMMPQQQNPKKMGNFKAARKAYKRQSRAAAEGQGGFDPASFGGSAGQAIIGFGFPLIYFLVYFFIHKSMDDVAIEIDEDGDREDREGSREKMDWKELMWMKFSVRQRMLMMAIALLFYIIGGLIVNPWRIWWRAVAIVMIATGGYSILWDSGRGSAYVYFRDVKDESEEEYKKTCVEFGCGYHPHNGPDCPANTSATCRKGEERDFD